MRRVSLLLAVLALVGCEGIPEDPPVNAVQEAFAQEDLTYHQAHGQRVFAQRCATCHGPRGRGDGQNAYNLQPPPPDFQGSLTALSRTDRRRVIEGGTVALGRSPLCPPWGPSLQEDESQALLAWMEVMEQPSEDEEESRPSRRRFRR